MRKVEAKNWFESGPDVCGEVIQMPHAATR
jgi:hypothetical protein